MPLSTAQIGRSGELLVQYRLLLLGVDSAPMSTDAGIDLVAYSPRLREAVTIQVKANLKPKPGGGKGKAGLDWWVPEGSPADFVAFVDLSSQRIWVMKLSELPMFAQQHANGRYHFFISVDPTYKPRKTDRIVHAYEFERFLIENRAHAIFDI
jgi:hypothetical protein